MARRMFKGSTVPTTLLGPITNSALTFTVVASGGSTYPDGSTGNFVVTLDFGASSGEEKVLCSARTGDVFTIASRGYDSTAASAHAAGANVRHTMSAVDLDEANAHINSTTSVHGIADTSLLLTTAAGNAAYTSATVVAGTGIDPTGVSDSTTAIQAILTAAANGATIYFPPGRYLLSSTLTITNKSVRLFGAGAYETILSWTACGANGAIYFNETGVGPFTASTQPHKFEVRDLSVLAGALNLPYGINVSFADASNVNRPLHIQNIGLGQNIEAATLGFFSVGIRCNNTRNSLINRVHAIGEINTNASGQKSNVGIQFDGECTDFKVTNCLFIEWLTHVKTSAPAVAGSGTEGLYVHNCDFVYGDNGVYFDCGTGGEPQLTVTASSFNTSVSGVTMINALQSVVADNAFFYGATSSSAGYTGVSVSGTNSRENRIIGNGFDTAGDVYAGTKTFISLLAGPRTVVAHNSMNSADTGINIAASVNATVVSGNNMNGVTTRVADAGGGTIVTGNMGRNTSAVWSSTNAIADIDGGSAAFQRFVDRGAGTNLTLSEFVYDGGAMRFELLNDNLTVKQQIFNIDSSGRWISGGGTARAINAQTTSGAVVMDASKGDVQAVTLNGNATSSSITNLVTGQILTIEWIQDATGSRTYVWPGNMKFAGGAAPVASTTAGWRDSVTFRTDGTSWFEISRSIGIR